MLLIDKIFDRYSLNARIKPAFLIVSPLVVTAYILIEPLRTLLGTILGLFVACGLIHLISIQMSTFGNRLQKKLFIKWDGAPTTKILRHSDGTLDQFTKERYRKKLVQLIPNFSNVTATNEAKNPSKADNYYETATRYLLEYTRDTKKYPLVFKENIAYGFSRNLLAFKGTAVTIIIISFLISLIFLYFKISEFWVDWKSLVQIPAEYYVLFSIHIIFILVWIFMIDEEFVKIRAEAYAKRLFSACEDI